MNHLMFCGREINVVAAVEKRKRPEDMRRRTGVRGHEGHHSSRHGRSLSRSRSCSRSPRHGRHAKSLSHSPAPRSRNDYSASSKRKEERQAKSSRQSEEHDKDKKQRSCTPDYRNDHHNGSNEKRATPDYSAPPKRKEERQTKSLRQLKEHDEDKKWGYCTPDDGNESNDCRVADNVSNQRRAATDGDGSRPHRRSLRSSSGSRSRRRDDYLDSPKGKEERLAKSPRQSKEHDEAKKRRSDTPDDRNDCRDADNGYSQRRDDYSTSPKRKEEGQEKSPELSKEHDKDKKRRSYTPSDRNNRRDADNGSKERLATTDGEGSRPRRMSPRPSSGSRSRRRDDYSASAKGKEERHAKSPRQSNEHDEDKKRRSYTHDRNDRRDADNGYNEQEDYSTSPKRKEERQARSPKLLKEHDKDKKQISYTPDDRNDRRDADNGSK